MSTPAPRPGPREAALRQAANLGRRHGKAAVYWQIGDSGSDAAQEFYRDLLRGIAGADPEITSLYEMPGLTAQQDYDRDNLAADLGLARDDPTLAAAAEAYLAAAREEFWLEAARLARQRLRSGPDHRAGGSLTGVSPMRPCPWTCGPGERSCCCSGCWSAGSPS